MRQDARLRCLACLVALGFAACGGATAAPDPAAVAAEPAPSPDEGSAPKRAEEAKEPFLQVTIAGQDRAVTSMNAYLDAKKNRMWINAGVARPGHDDESLWILFPAGELGTFHCDEQHGVSYFQTSDTGEGIHPLSTDAELPSILSVQKLGEVGAYVDGSFAGKLLYRETDAMSPDEVVLASGQFHVKRSPDR